MQILGVTCNNAENNATMMEEVEKLAPSIRGSRVRVRCFDHILNLVVKVRIRSRNNNLMCHI